MDKSVDDILEKIRELETELEAEFAKRRAGLRYGIERGRVMFEQEVVRRQKELRTNVFKYVLSARFLVIVTSPVIYSLIVPFVMLDLWVSAYQAICFRVYRIPQVKRSQYIVLDRAGLAYLNVLERMNCAYCSYVNGIIAYAREIGARTEQFWCPIKNARRLIGAHARYAGFEIYGDGETYHDQLQAQREKLRTEGDAVESWHESK